MKVAEFILGYAAEEICGQNVSAILPEAYSGGQASWMVQAAQQNAPNSLSQYTTVGLRKNGTPVSLSLAINRAREGEDHLLVVALHYIAQVESRSERRLATTTVQAPERQPTPDQPLDLNKPQRRFPLAEQLTEVGNRTLNVAHDFNSPVFGVRQLVTHLRSMVQLSDHQKALFDLLERKCRRIGDNIRGLKDFYRPQSGVGGPLNLNEALEDILTLNQKAFQNRNIRLEKHYADDLPDIDAVSDQVHQALQNLIRHSEESIPEGGGEMMIATECENGDVKIYIMDSGNGMAPGYLESQFDAVTGKPAVVDNDPALPLQYCVNIIKTHGGSIEVSRREGQGNVYTITLPVKGIH